MMASLRKRWWYLAILAVLGRRLHETLSQGDWLGGAWIAISVLGVALNVLVILLNDGMPAHVRPEEIPEEERSTYKPIDGSTRLALIADWIPLGNLLISPGDILIALGVLGIVAQAIMR